jgi:hypothetical protein
MSNKISYTFGGLLLGILLGSLLGLAESNYTKKSQRGQTVPLLTIMGAIGGGLIGAFYGHKIGLKHDIEEKTGISKEITDFQKDGRYWLGETYWTDTRERDKINRLETKRIGKGLIITTLNSVQIYVHSTESASKESISKCHNLAKQFVFDKVIETFNEITPKNLIELFKLK